MPQQNIHVLGVQRHGTRWLLANERAVEELTAADTKLKAHQPDVKKALPRIILRLLDYMMIETGHQWNEQACKWETKPKFTAEDRIAASMGHSKPTLLDDVVQRLADDFNIEAEVYITEDGSGVEVIAVTTEEGDIYHFHTEDETWVARLIEQRTDAPPLFPLDINSACTNPDVIAQGILDSLKVVRDA